MFHFFATFALGVLTISPTALSWRLQSGHALPNSTFAGPFVSAKLSAWAPEPELELETAKRVIQPWAQMTRMLAPIRCQKHRPPRIHSWQEPCLRCGGLSHGFGGGSFADQVGGVHATEQKKQCGFWSSLAPTP